MELNRLQCVQQRYVWSKLACLELQASMTSETSCCDRTHVDWVFHSSSHGSPQSFDKAPTQERDELRSYVAATIRDGSSNHLDDSTSLSLSLRISHKRCCSRSNCHRWHELDIACSHGLVEAWSLVVRTLCCLVTIQCAARELNPVLADNLSGRVISPLEKPSSHGTYNWL